jgi:signal transduction histidine kinase
MDQQSSPKSSTKKVRITHYGVIVAVIWTLLIAYSLYWEHLQHQEEALLLGKIQGRSYFEKDVLYRRWASRHGGVYVPVTESTQPNPYLSHVPERDITTPSGRQLTLMNPAYMTRQVYEMAQEYKGTGRGHITSLKPIRPANTPDPWEKESLLAFERGALEVGHIEQIDGKPYYRYMKSLIADKPCLKCHQSQGYREGDVRGGLSVSVAMEPIYAMMAKELRRVYINHTIIWLLGIGMIGYGTRKLDGNTTQLYEKTGELEHEVEERKIAQEQLQEKASLLEEEIAERQISQEALQEQTIILEEEIEGHRRTEQERKRTEDERSRLEAQLQQAQKMESVGRLAGGVAHDFNNILTVIQGYSQIGLMETDPSQRIFSHFEEIRKASERAAGLTHQLLAFARKQIIEPKVINLNESVAGMLKMLQRLIGENVQLNWQAGANLWPVKIDPSQVDQLLANLCVNARDAMADVGKITIGTENCAIDTDFQTVHGDVVSPSEYVLLTVTDNGCGMNHETLTNIFEPFFTTKGIGEGTGLGLATVFGIVKQNSGIISVSSEPGVGTTFTIYLPHYLGQSEQTQGEGTAESAPCGQETILLVEDDQAILNMTAMILSKQGYTVLKANTAAEAIRLAKEQLDEISLLVTDVIMPEMNGKDLANNLQLLNPQLKSLFMSGYTADAIAQHGVLNEGVNFIQKPFSLPDLAKKVRSVLDSK